MIKYFCNIVITLFLICLTYNANALPDNSNENQKLFVEINFNHANTYYWYGRYKSNTLLEFEKAKVYLQKADSALKKISKSDLNKNFIIEYTTKIKELNEAIKLINTICIDNLNGRFPLYNAFAGLNNEYEFYDEPDEFAVETSLKKLLNTAVRYTKNVENTTLFSFLVLKPFDANMEEIAQQYLNINSSQYIISQYELIGILGTTGFDSVNNGLYSNNILAKIAGFFNVEEIGIFEIIKNDETDGLYYYGTRFSRWVKKTGSFNSVYTEGFRIDKKALKMKANLFVILLVVLAITVLIVSFFIIKEKGNLVYNIIIFFISLFISIGFLILVNHSLNGFYPLSSYYYNTPETLIWRLLFSLTAGVLSASFLFFITSLYYKKLLLRLSGIITFIVPAVISFGLIQAWYSIIVLGFSKEVILVNVLYFSVTIIAGLLMSKTIYSVLMEKSVIFNNLSLVLFGTGLTYLTFYIIKYFSLEHTFTTLIHSTLFFIPAIIIELYPSIVKTGKKNISSVKSYYPNNKEGFIKFLTEESIFIEPDTWNDKIKEIKGSSSKGVITITLKGDIGVGKTKYAQELINYCLSNYDNGKLHTGICSKDTGGNVITYQVLLEAFGDIVGKGKFKDPGRGVSKYLKKVKGSPLESYLSFFTTNIDNNDNMPSYKDMSDSIYVDLSKNNLNDIIFIDNIQWIDDSSAKVITDLMSRFLRNKNSNKTIFIFNIRLNSKKSDGYKRIEENLIRFNRLDGFKEIKIEPSDLIISHFGELFIKRISKTNLVGFKFSFNTESRLISFFKTLEQKYEKGKVILFFKYLINNEILKFDNNTIKLSKKTDIESLFDKIKTEEHVIGYDGRISSKLRKVLETAAYIGKSFNLQVLTEIWEMKRFNMVILLNEAETKGIIKGYKDNDDFYEFVSGGAAEQFINSLENNQEISKLAKEYNIRIINVYEKLTGNNIKKFSDELVFSMANRSYNYNIPEKRKIYLYNNEAGNRCFSFGNFNHAQSYFENAISVLKKYFAEDRASIFNTYLNKGKAIVDSGSLLPWDYINDMDVMVKKIDSRDLTAEYYLLKARDLFFKVSLNDLEGIKKIDDVLNKIPLCDSPEIDLEKRFYKAYYVSINLDDNKEKVLNELKKLLKEAENTKNKNERLLKLTREMCNSLASGYFKTNNKLAIRYLDKLIVETNSGNKKYRVPLSSEDRELIIINIINNLKSFSSHQKNGISIALYHYSNLFLEEDELDRAVFFLKNGIILNDKIGNSKGLVSINYLMIILYLKKKKPKTAIKYLWFVFDEAKLNNDCEYLNFVLQTLEKEGLKEFLSKEEYHKVVKENENCN